MPFRVELELPMHPASHILVVDDDEIAVEIISNILLESGYKVSTARDGFAALAQVRAEPIDVVISDWIMPGMDGVELCKTIRREVERYVYFVLVTARDRVDDVIEGLQSGADDFIPKPFDPFELQARVKAMIRLKRLHDEIAAQREQLLRTQQLKDDWTNMVVHDLRSPLLCILGYAELAAAEAPQVAAQLSTVHQEAQRLSEMLEQMLLMAKSEDGRLQPRFVPCDAVVIVRSALQAIAPVASARGVTVELAAPEQQPLIADRSLVRRLIDNLLSNAVKFSPSGSTVRVELASDDRQLQLTVSDEGPGVPAEATARLFEKYEVAGLRRLGVPQHGLGLAFCRLVTLAHGGTIGHQPAEPRGSRFRATLALDPIGAPDHEGSTNAEREPTLVLVQA